jgi:hypothetical protein
MYHGRRANRAGRFSCLAYAATAICRADPGAPNLNIPTR